MSWDWVYFVAYEAACALARRFAAIASLLREVEWRIGPRGIALADGDLHPSLRVFTPSAVAAAIDASAGQARRYARLAFAHVSELL